MVNDKTSIHPKPKPQYTKPKPRYPTSCSDADLANKFADFFTEKIVRIQNSLVSPTSTPGQLLDVSPPPDCVLSCFETVTEDHVASLITSSAIKCCPLDPAPAVILKECLCNSTRDYQDS